MVATIEFIQTGDIYPEIKVMYYQKSSYEQLLAEYCHHEGAIALLKQFRPYLEMLPSMRRPEASMVTIPLPVIKIRGKKSTSESNSLGGEKTAVQLPCDLAIILCDPEWQVKMDGEIFIFIHRPEEDFSDLLGRWRQTQVLLEQDYEWIMPHGQKHIYSETTERLYPLFVILPETPQRICRGLQGANLPFVISLIAEEEGEERAILIPEY